MIGSLWTGISGLTSQQSALDNEANNIANVNTIGYKASRISFADQMYQNDIGKGVRVSDAEKMFSQGSLKLTGVSYDMALEGDGFFSVVNEKVGGVSEVFYTRAGNFRKNDAGEMTDAVGNKVQGWAMGTPGVEVSTGNTDTIFTTDYINLVDSKIILKDGSIETKTLRLTDYSSANAANTAALEAAIATYRTELSEYQDDPDTAQNLTDLNTARDALEAAAVTAGSKAMEITTTVFNGKTNTKSSMQLQMDTLGISDSPFGELSVTDDGVVLMRQNGADYAIGQVALARFSNNRGLEAVGGNMYRANALSGEPIYNENNNLMAKVSGGTLEMSNADLSESLVNMIVYQRGFEANAKTVTTSDEILTALMGIKR